MLVPPSVFGFGGNKAVNSGLIHPFPSLPTNVFCNDIVPGAMGKPVPANAVWITLTTQCYYFQKQHSCPTIFPSLTRPWPQVRPLVDSALPLESPDIVELTAIYSPQQTHSNTASLMCRSDIKRCSLITQIEHLKNTSWFSQATSGRALHIIGTMYEIDILIGSD